MVTAQYFGVHDKLLMITILRLFCTLRWFTSARLPPPCPRQLAQCRKTRKTKSRDGWRQPRSSNLPKSRASCHLCLCLFLEMKQQSLQCNYASLGPFEGSLNLICVTYYSIESTMQLKLYFAQKPNSSVCRLVCPCSVINIQSTTTLKLTGV